MDDKEIAPVSADAKKAQAAPEPSQTDTMIEAWFVENFHSSIVSGDVQIFNYVRAATDKLKAILNG